jgi:uracil-DNA glycosylase family 4
MAVSDVPASSNLDPLTQLTVIHEEINACRRCEPLVDGFRKPLDLDRGESGRLLIVGQGPGKAEVRRGRAFAGQSGTTLDSWLRAAGLDSDNPRRGVYLTSVIKCCHSSSKDFDLMARNCGDFLQRQIMAVKPALVISLGRSAYLSLRFTAEDFSDALCRPLHTSSTLLVSQFGFHFWLLPWPHPSGLNRWHNAAENRQRLQGSFAFVKQVLWGER